MVSPNPFDKKVGTVRNKYGERVGTVYQRGEMSDETFGCLGCLAGIAAVVALIVGVVYLIGAGTIGLKNLVTHGEFTTDTLAAEVRDHEDDPDYFAKRAQDAKLSFVDVKYSVVRHEDLKVVFSVQNDSDDKHTFMLGEIVVRARADGKVGKFKLNCSPSIDDSYEVAGHARSDQVVQITCGNEQRFSGPIKVARKPSFREIDRLPVTGGPANTSWYGE